MLGSIMTFVSTNRPELARSFYEKTLGLACRAEDAFAIVFDCRGIVLRVTKAPPFTPQPFTVLGWAVDAIESEVDTLAARGVTFERFPGLEQDSRGIWRAPGGAAVAWFKDPDGNLLSLTQAPS